MDETITRLKYDLDHKKAVEFIKFINLAEKEGFLRIEWVNKKYYQQALQIFTKYDDQIFSFTDCTSFVICQKNSIQEVMAFDDDFIKMDFRTPFKQ